MSWKNSDQAEGLRRLLVKVQGHTITLVSAQRGAGKSSVVANLATTMAAAGKDVLVIDQSRLSRPVGRLLGIAAGPDLLDVISGASRLDQAVSRSALGPALLSARRALRPLHRTEPLHLQLEQLAQDYDTVLVDAGDAAEFSPVLPLAGRQQEIVVVMTAQGESITDAYALIKSMHWRLGQRRYGILLNQADSDQEAGHIFNNMARVAQNYLAVTLDLVGVVPRDGWMRQAGQLNQPVVEAFPRAPAAAAIRAVADRLAHRQLEKSTANITVSTDPVSAFGRAAKAVNFA